MPSATREKGLIPPVTAGAIALPLVLPAVGSADGSVIIAIEFPGRGAAKAGLSALLENA